MTHTPLCVSHKHLPTTSSSTMCTVHGSLDFRPLKVSKLNDVSNVCSSRRLSNSVVLSSGGQGRVASVMSVFTENGVRKESSGGPLTCEHS